MMMMMMVVMYHIQKQCIANELVDMATNSTTVVVCTYVLFLPIDKAVLSSN